jgi:hypothetical protein
MKLGTSKWGNRPGLGLLSLSPSITEAQYIYLGAFDLRATAHRCVMGGFTPSGGVWSIKQDGATSLLTGARRDTPSGFSMSFKVLFDNETDANAFRYYCVQMAKDADIALFVRDNSWYFRVWGISLKQMPIDEACSIDYTDFMYEVICHLYSPYTYQIPSSSWYSANASLPQECGHLTNIGHYENTFQSLQATCHYNGAHVKALVLSVQGNSDTLTICDEALSDEIWELRGEDNQLFEEYNAVFTSLAIMQIDASGTYTKGSGNWMAIASGQYAIWKLSGPHPLRYPVKMTADLHLVAGSPVVEISSDGISWEAVLTSADFTTTGIAKEYVLNHSEFMTNCYIRFSCLAAGSSMVCGALKLECERWIEADSIPTIPIGTSRTATLSATGGSMLVDIMASFRNIRHMI